MLLQWVLMPVTSVVYSAASALNAQGHLLFGKYLDKFDVTEKATVKEIKQAQKAKAKQRRWWQWWKGGRGGAQK